MINGNPLIDEDKINKLRLNPDDDPNKDKVTGPPGLGVRVNFGNIKFDLTLIR